MLTEVMESYGLVKEFRQAGYYETVCRATATVQRYHYCHFSGH